MKKIIGLLLSLLITVSCLSSCVKSDGEEIDWVNIVLSDVLPEPQSNLMSIADNDKSAMNIDILEISQNQFLEYIRLCEDAGYDVDSVRDGGTSFQALNRDGYSLTLVYSSSDDRMNIQLTAPSSNSADTPMVSGGQPEDKTDLSDILGSNPAEKQDNQKNSGANAEPENPPAVTPTPTPTPTPVVTATPNVRPELSAEAVYAQCSPCVFFIETFDAKGNLYATGSGFFVSGSGKAVTNYHVIEDAFSARITVSDTGKVYALRGVYDYSKAEDWAVIQIDGSGFSPLSIGDSDNVTGGTVVYAIGSPLGLQNTISQGLVSNPSRIENGVKYIQTNAAISSGSSGGALLNKHGEVIGITSASYVSGQNLNLALPISVIDDHKTGTVQTLLSIITGNNQSEIKGYSDYPEIPDFGALNAVTPISKASEYGGVSYYYSHSSLKTAGTYTMSCNLYDKIARSWGFTDVKYYQRDDGSFITEYICETTSYTYYIDFALLDKLDGVDCMSLWLFAEAKKSAVGYSKTPAVPDFGAYFGVSPTYTSSITMYDAYWYSLNDLYAVGAYNTFFDLYWNLLEEWGFTCTKSEPNNSGTIYTFKNAAKGFTINLGVNESDIKINIFYF